MAKNKLMLNIITKLAIFLLFALALSACTGARKDLDAIQKAISSDKISLSFARATSIDRHRVELQIVLENKSDIDVCTLAAGPNQAPYLLFRERDGAYLREDDYKIYERDGGPDPFPVELIRSGERRIYLATIDLRERGYFSLPEGSFGGRFVGSHTLFSLAELPVFSCVFQNAKIPINRGLFSKVESDRSPTFLGTN